MDRTWGTLQDLDEADDRKIDIEEIQRTIDFSKLELRALHVRRKIHTDSSNALQCRIDHEQFAVGRFNVVFILSFSDGIRWVARISLSRDEQIESAIEAEVAVVDLVRSQTDIPVPAIYDYKATVDDFNPIGYQYMLMDRIPGDRLRLTKSKMPAETRPRFAAQFAKYLYQLSTLRFEDIGPVTLKTVSGGHTVKPLTKARAQTSTSTTSLEYIYECRLAINQETQDLTGSPETIAAARQFLLQAVPLAVESNFTHGPFPLTHIDIHSENILVDQSFNIVGIIDWTNVQALPIEVFATNQEFLTAFGLSDEENEPTVQLRSLIAGEFRQLAAAAEDEYGAAIADLIGTPKSELAYHLTSSPGRLVVIDAKMRILRLVYGKNAKWEDVEKLIVQGPSFLSPSNNTRATNSASTTSVLGKRDRE